MPALTRADAAKCRRHVLDDTVGKVIVVSIGAEIVERQYGKRRLAFR